MKENFLKRGVSDDEEFSEEEFSQDIDELGLDD